MKDIDFFQLTIKFIYTLVLLGFYQLAIWVLDILIFLVDGIHSLLKYFNTPA